LSPISARATTAVEVKSASKGQSLRAGQRFKSNDIVSSPGMAGGNVIGLARTVLTGPPAPRPLDRVC